MHVYVFHYYTKIGHFRRHHYQHHWVKCHYILMCGSYAEQNVSRELRELTNERHFLWPCDTGITARTGHSYKHVTGGGETSLQEHKKILVIAHGMSQHNKKQHM